MEYSTVEALIKAGQFTEDTYNQICNHARKGYVTEKESKEKLKLLKENYDTKLLAEMNKHTAYVNGQTLDEKLRETYGDKAKAIKKFLKTDSLKFGEDGTIEGYDEAVSASIAELAEIGIDIAPNKTTPSSLSFTGASPAQGASNTPPTNVGDEWQIDPATFKF